MLFVYYRDIDNVVEDVSIVDVVDMLHDVADDRAVIVVIDVVDCSMDPEGHSVGDTDHELFEVLAMMMLMAVTVNTTEIVVAAQLNHQTTRTQDYLRVNVKLVTDWTDARPNEEFQVKKTRHIVGVEGTADYNWHAAAAAAAAGSRGKDYD
ncbi:hypothetical protein HDU76_011750 [Blyttiomyces sp. JEL0837]|nr:hypothetical protein HDU76_011750 [Blyttiomyces sp. JEL0837]